MKRKLLRLVRVSAGAIYTPQGKVDAPDGFHVNDFPEDRFFTVEEAVDWFKAQIERYRLKAIEVEVEGEEFPSKWHARVALQKVKAKKRGEGTSNPACEICRGRGAFPVRPPDSFEASSAVTFAVCPSCNPGLTPEQARENIKKLWGIE